MYVIELEPTSSNDKSNSVSVLAWDQHRKTSTVTSLFDLWLGVKDQRKVKSQTTSNGKSNSVSMLTLDRRPKLSTVTFSSDLWLRGQRSKKGQISNMLKWQK